MNPPAVPRAAVPRPHHRPMNNLPPSRLASHSAAPASAGGPGPLLVEQVEGDRAQHHQALDRLLVVDPDAHEGHAVVHDRHDQSADNGPGDRPDAAGDGRPADEAGRDGVELEALAGLGPMTNEMPILL